MLAGWDTTYGDFEAYDACFADASGGLSRTRRSARGAASSPEGAAGRRRPGAGRDEQAFTSSWTDFLALEASWEEADWSCRADVYEARLDQVARDVEEFASEHADEIERAARAWDDVVARAALLPDPRS